MKTLESLLSDYSRVELLEYEVVVGGHVRLVLLGYPKHEGSEPKSDIYRLIFKTPQSIAFDKLNAPTDALISARSNMTAGSVAVSLEFAGGASIKISCGELVWV